MGWHHCVLLALLWLYFGNCNIIFKDNGYRGIIVGIKHRIAEDEMLIERIKSLFNNGSILLHTVTNGRAYFNEVTIAIPSTWSAKPYYEEVLVDYFPRSHVRVDIQNPVYKDLPYTLQHERCGVQAEYIHLTPGFVNGKFRARNEKFERYLIHEWIHFRYGVFDEYSIPHDPRFPPFYLKNDEVFPTSCVEGIDGWYHGKQGRVCKIHLKTEEFKNCIFEPNVNSQTFSASIMYGPGIVPLDKLCDETKLLKHNRYAPTPQNVYCFEKSAGSVVESHEDFQGKPKAIPISKVTATKFRLVRRRHRAGTIVLVLDVSTSMNAHSRISWLKLTAGRFVKDVEDGTRLGIVTFTGTAKILFPLKEVTSQTRNQMANEISKLRTEDWTSIGAGLQMALEMLKRSIPGSIEGTVISLMTDGLENRNPLIEHVKPNVVREKVIINTIAFGPTTDKQLESLAGMTGGMSHLIKDLSPKHATNKLESSFVESLTSQSDIDFQPIQLFRDSEIIIGPRNTTSITVFIDSEIGHKTKFNILCSDITKIDATVTDSHLTTYDKRSSQHKKDDKVSQSINFIFDKAKIGNWTVRMTNVDNKNPYEVSLTITSWPNDIRQQPVRIRAWVSDFIPVSEEIVSVLVRAEVKKDYSAVIKATVIATLLSPNGRKYTGQMKDEGEERDLIADDGIYVASFDLKFLKGRYDVSAKVVSDGKAKLLKGSVSLSSSAAPEDRFMTTEEAERLGLGIPRNKFNISEFIHPDENDTSDDQDEVNPVIKDLGLISRVSFPISFTIPMDLKRPELPSFTSTFYRPVISSVERNITLRWKIPKDAWSIEIRVDACRNNLIHSSKATHLLYFNNVREKTSNTSHHLQIKNLTLNLPEAFYPENSDTLKTVYFSFVALKKDGNALAPPTIAAKILGLEQYAANFIEKNTKLSGTEKRWGVGIIVVMIIIAVISAVPIIFRKYLKDVPTMV